MPYKSNQLIVENHPIENLPENGAINISDYTNERNNDAETITSGYAKTILADLNSLRDKVYKDALLHGLWKDNPSNEHFLMETIVEIVETIEANKIHKRAAVYYFNESIRCKKECISENDFIHLSGIINVL